MDPEKEFRCKWCNTTKPNEERIDCANNEPDPTYPKENGMFPHSERICQTCSTDGVHCRYCVPKEKSE